MAKKLNITLLKLQGNLSLQQSNDLNNIKRRFYFDDTPWWGESHRLHNMDVSSRNLLTVTYSCQHKFYIIEYELEQTV